MVTSNNKDKCEESVKALWPEEFPEDQEAVQEHLKECPQCREELAMLRDLDSIFRERREELRAAVAECPDSMNIVLKGLDESVPKEIDEHIENCPDCFQEVRLVRESSKEAIEESQPQPLTTEEKIFLKNLVEREYGKTAVEDRDKESGIMSMLSNLFHAPSLAFGAVVAALLVILVTPGEDRKDISRIAFSDVDWNIDDSANKSSMFEPAGPGADKVAIVIILDKGLELSQAKIDTLYTKLSIANDLVDQYRFASPDEIKKALASAPTKIGSPNELADNLFAQVKVHKVLLIQFGKDNGKGRATLNLFDQSSEKPKMTIQLNDIEPVSNMATISRLGLEMLVLKTTQ